MYSRTDRDGLAASSVCCGQSSLAVGRYALVPVGVRVRVPAFPLALLSGPAVSLSLTVGHGLDEVVVLFATLSPLSFFACVPSTMPTPVPSTARKSTAMITAPVAP